LENLLSILTTQLVCESVGNRVHIGQSILCLRGQLTQNPRNDDFLATRDARRISARRLPEI
jgi:hypothetical protein